MPGYHPKVVPSQLAGPASVSSTRRFCARPSALAWIQNCRSAGCNRGRGCRRRRTTSCCRKHRFSATSRAFGLRSAAITHAIHRITHPSRCYRRSRECSIPSDWREVPRMRFLRPTAPNRVVAAHVKVDVRVIVGRRHADALELLDPDADLRHGIVVPELGIGVIRHGASPARSRC
jgi:hypothetical protein